MEHVVVVVQHIVAKLIFRRELLPVRIVLVCGFFLCRLTLFKQLGHGFLGLHVLVEHVQLVADGDDLLDLRQQDLVELERVVLNVAARLVCLIQQRHFFLGVVDGVVDVLAMAGQHALLIFQNLLDQSLVLLVELGGVPAMLLHELVLGWHAGADDFGVGASRLLLLRLGGTGSLLGLEGAHLLHSRHVFVWCLLGGRLLLHLGFVGLSW